MPSAKKPEITNGQSLDVQPGVSNIGENQAMMEALRNANIDGQDTFPTSVTAQRMASGDIDVSGLVRSGTMLVGSGGVTVTSDADGGTPATGLHVGASVLQLIKTGVAQVTLDGTTGNATFVGAVTATSGSFTGAIYATDGYFVGSITIGTSDTMGSAATGVWLSATRLLMKYGGTTKIDFNTATNAYTFSGGTITAMSSVNFGTDITIGGDIILHSSSVDGRIYFDGDGGTKYIDLDSDYFGIPMFGMVDSNSSSGGVIGIAQGGSTWTALIAAPRMYIYAGDIVIQNDGANGPNATTRDMTLGIGTNAGNLFALKRGTTTVMSFVGNANTVTFAGDVTVTGIITSNSASASVFTGNISLVGHSAIYTTGSDNLTIGSGADLYLTGGDDVIIAAASGGSGYVGLAFSSSLVLTNNNGGNVVDVFVKSGTPTTEGTTGALWISDGGSLWFKQSTGWKRIDNWLT